MRAFDPDVADAVWHAIEALIPVRVDDHPLGCHRRRIPDRLCFRGILVRLVTGCSWVDAEWLLDHQVSDTTLRARRDEWVAAGVFDHVADEAVAAYDRIIGLRLAHASLDASPHKAPRGGEGTGPNYWDRAKLGWKWSIVADEEGIPVGWTVAAASRPDGHLLPATLDAAAARGLLVDIDLLHLDRGYNWRPVLAEATAGGWRCRPRPGGRGPRPATAATPGVDAASTTPPSSRDRTRTAGRWSAPTAGSPTSANCAATPTDAALIAPPSWLSPLPS